MGERNEKQEPIQQSVYVDCPIDAAFRFFTEAFGDWWPLAAYSNSGDEAGTCVIEPWLGGRVFERTRSGEEHEWGEVTEWDPPRHLRLNWDPAAAGDHAGTVEVEFNVEADGTRVTLIHSGWESPGVAVCALDAGGTRMWSSLLQYFMEFIAAHALTAA